MEEINKMSEIHRIVMNYWKLITTSNFSNKEDEESYTQGVLNEIKEIVNSLPIQDVCDWIDDEQTDCGCRPETCKRFKGNVKT